MGPTIAPDDEVAGDGRESESPEPTATTAAAARRRERREPGGFRAALGEEPEEIVHRGDGTEAGRERTAGWERALRRERSGVHGDALEEPVLVLADEHGQECEVGGRDALDSPGLAEGFGPETPECLACFGAERVGSGVGGIRGSRRGSGGAHGLLAADLGLTLDVRLVLPVGGTMVSHRPGAQAGGCRPGSEAMRFQSSGPKSGRRMRSRTGPLSVRERDR